MLFEEFPAIVILNIQAPEIIDTGFKTVLFDGSEQFVLEGVDTSVETPRSEEQPQRLRIYLHLFRCNTIQYYKN